MQRGKNMMYATAGVQMAPGIQMNVRSHVFVPDAEAGSENQYSYYQAGAVVERKQDVYISRNRAAVIILILFAVLALLVGAKGLQYARLNQRLRMTEIKIQEVKEANLLNAAPLAEARDMNRIRYKATKEYGMVSIHSVESIPVIAPETRGNPSYTNGLTADSPFADGYGMITGSR